MDIFLGEIQDLRELYGSFFYPVSKIYGSFMEIFLRVANVAVELLTRQQLLQPNLVVSTSCSYCSLYVFLGVKSST